MADDPGPALDLEPAKTQKCTKAKRQRVVDRVVPVLVLGINAYILYSFCYEVVWKWVPRRGVRIAIYTIMGVLNFLMLGAWAAVHLVGPGRVDESYQRIDSPDEPFVCGEDGYTPWCSTCQHFKPARCHHSSTEGACVPVMDHFCIWLGKVIGQGNLKFFIQFVVYSWCIMVLILVVQFCYQNKQLPHIAAQSIPVYVISGFWFAFLTVLLGQHVYLIATSQTTLEHMDERKKRVVFFNIPFQGSRRVITAESSDLVPGPYSEGLWQNCRRVMGPWYTWLLPIRPPIFEQSFNRDLLKRLQARQEKIESAAPAELGGSDKTAVGTPDTRGTPSEDPETSSAASGHLSLSPQGLSLQAFTSERSVPETSTAGSFVTAPSVGSDSFVTAPTAGSGSFVTAGSVAGSRSDSAAGSNASIRTIRTASSVSTIVP